MRPNVDEESIRRLTEGLGEVAPPGTRLYLTGGATAVLAGWRTSTVDVDLMIEPDSGAVIDGIAALKAKLDVNVEFASPLDFLPELPGWRERSRSRYRTGNLTVLDFDPYSQALAKIERGFDLDREDVAQMIEGGLVKPGRLRELFAEIEAELGRFPAVDAATLRSQLEQALDSPRRSPGPSGP